jgi:hypothetical protein
LNNWPGKLGFDFIAAEHHSPTDYQQAFASVIAQGAGAAIPVVLVESVHG